MALSTIKTVVLRLRSLGNVNKSFNINIRRLLMKLD